MREMPSAEELEWMAHIRIHLERVCETSPRMRNIWQGVLNKGLGKREGGYRCVRS
jgi:hypothetical protein